MDILVFSSGMKLLVGLLCDCFWICLCWSWCSCWGWNWGKPAFYQGWGPHYNLKASQLSTMTRTSKGVVASVDFVPCFFFFSLRLSVKVPGNKKTEWIYGLITVSTQCRHLRAGHEEHGGEFEEAQSSAKEEQDVLRHYLSKDMIIFQKAYNMKKNVVS